MSAVAGVLHRDDRPLDAGALGRMIAALGHRGPDGVGIWSQGPVGLAHGLLRTLRTAPEERRPLVSPGGNLVLSADARLDNRAELIATLGLTAHPPEAVGDDEVILAAYARWGEGAPERLLGDFALVVWDRQSRALFCARDRLGVRPLYYWASDRTFACASEIKALLALPDVPRRLNEARVADHLGGAVTDKTATFYRDVERLPPGHCLRVERQALGLRRYWALDPGREVRRESDRAYAEAFRALLAEAVRDRLRAAVPVGTTLSGGLDSSSVACIARDLAHEQGRGPLHTFSALFPGVPRADEVRLIDAVVREGKVVAHHLRGDEIDPLGDLRVALPHLDEPSYSTVVLLYRALSFEARERGVRVLLDGLEGDTTVSHGTAYPLELARSGRWVALASEILAFSRMDRSSPARLLWQTFRPLAPPWVRRLRRRLAGRASPMPDLVLRADLARRTGLEERLAARQEEWRKGARTARQDHWRRLDSPLLTHAVESVGQAASGFGVELRHPFLDPRLVEFCLSLPGSQTLRRGQTRVVLREAMAGLLPEEVRWRQGKADLRAVIPHALGRARAALGAALDEAAGPLSAYVDLAALRGAYDRFCRAGLARDAMTVWKAVTFAVWARHRGFA